MTTFTVHVPTDQQLQIAVNTDPLGTVQTSLVELFGPLQQRMPRDVLAQASRHAKAADLDTLLSATQFDDGPGLADFLWPDMAAADQVSLADQIQQIAATPTSTILSQVSTLAGPIPTPRQQVWLDTPQAALSRYVGALSRYTSDVLEKVYPRFEQRIRAESLYLQDLISRGDIDTSLVGIHPAVQLQDGTLQLPMLSDQPMELNRDRLVLSPMICSRHTLSFNGVEVPEGDPQLIAFATRSLAVTGLAPVDPPRPDPIAMLLGDARATILRALFVPSTTTELANNLGYSPSTISHHLKALTSAQAVESHRNHWFVYYRLSDIGRALLTLYS